MLLTGQIWIAVAAKRFLFVPWMTILLIFCGEAPVFSVEFEQLAMQPVEPESIAQMGDSEGEWVSVARLPWVTATAGWSGDGSNQPVRNRDAAKVALVCGGRPVGFGVGTHAPSRIELDLNGTADRFRARTWCGEAGGSVRFEVWGDGRQLYSGPDLGYSSQAIDLDIDVEGVDRLELIVGDAGDGIQCDMANWGLARLLLKPDVDVQNSGHEDVPAAVPAAGEFPSWRARTEIHLAPVSVPDMVRRDWYFRETLPAIRDWEELAGLSGLDSDGSGFSGAVLPVPPNGMSSSWPNPIPRRLVFADGRGHAESWSVRVDEGSDSWRAEPRNTAGTPADATDQTLPWGESMLGFHHTGAGDHDMWYHGYQREFESVCRFTCKPAAFALRVENAPIEWRKGRNEVRLIFSNSTNVPQKLDIRMDQYFPGGEQSSFGGMFELDAAVEAGVVLPVWLERTGGGVVVVLIQTGGNHYRIPFLTYVEDIQPVLDSIEQILADHPDPAGREKFNELKDMHRELLGQQSSDPASGEDWTGLFECASHLRDNLLRRLIEFDDLLLVKRMPFISEQPYMDAHHLYNRPGGGIYRLSPVGPEGVLFPVVDDMGEGIYRDICLSPDAKNLLFSFGQGSDDWDPDAQSYHIYEVGIDGGNLRQLTFGEKNDCEPVYAPDGRVVFTSDRPEHFVLCGGPRHASLLYSMNRDGTDLTQLSFNVVNDFNPSILPDGRIIYDRWEYNERSVTSLHSLFTMRPDGTQVAPFFGNQSIRPNVIMFPRAVPGSNKIMALLTGHHGQTHGPVALIDHGYAVNGMDAVEVLTPGIPVTGEKIENSWNGWCSRPWPLSEDLFLMSFTPTIVPWREASWAVYVSDRHGNMALLHRDPEISLTEPVPLMPTLPPQPLPGPQPGSDRYGEELDATLLLVDARMGQDDVAVGETAALRIFEDVPRKSVPEGQVIPVSATSMYTVKRVIGTVPVQEDGSVFFRVPANRPLYFSILDSDGLEIQRMRSSICLKPGEVQTCLGCHESRHLSPPNGHGLPLAARSAPVEPRKPTWGWSTLSYLRDVQPVLDRNCMPCHARSRKENAILLTSELTDRYALSYEELLPFIKTAYAMRWDVPYDVERVPARDFGSGASELMKILRAGHYGVELSPEDKEVLGSWIDCNGVYYGWYEQAWPDRRIMTEPWKSQILDVDSRRCSGCHSDHGTVAAIPWPLACAEEVLASSPLLAPLSESAGGWGSCAGVFEDREDPDWKRLCAAFEQLGRALKDNPRQDLRELTGRK